MRNDSVSYVAKVWDVLIGTQDKDFSQLWIFVSQRGARREKNWKIKAMSIIMVRFVRISVIRVCLQVINIPSGLWLKIQGHTQEMIFIFAKLKHWFSSLKKIVIIRKSSGAQEVQVLLTFFFSPQSTFSFCLINMAYAEYFKALTCYSDISSKDILKSNVLKVFHLWMHLFLMTFSIILFVKPCTVQCSFSIFIRILLQISLITMQIKSLFGSY